MNMDSHFKPPHAGMLSHHLLAPVERHLSRRANALRALNQAGYGISTARIFRISRASERPDEDPVPAPALDYPTLRLLADAVEEAWKSLVASSSPFASAGCMAVTRTRLADYIVAHGRQGERDRARLVEGALKNLATPVLHTEGR